MRRKLPIIFTLGLLLTASSAWALDVKDGDVWDETTKTLTVNSDPGYSAYANQTEIEHLFISSGVTDIKYSAFKGCSGIATIEVDAGNKTYDSRNNCNAIIIKTSSELVLGCKNTTIPSSVTKIGLDAFYGCTGLTTISLPSSVTFIGSEAFYGCTGLTTISIPSSVTFIGSETFRNCTELTTIAIPKSVTTINA